MSQDLQTARYDQLLRRVGALIGPGSKVTEVLAELFPVLDVENVPGELLRLMGTKLGMGGVGLTAVAGQSAKIQLFNPQGSGQLITITLVISSTPNNGDVTSWAFGQVGLTTLVAGTPFRDTRDGLAPITVGQVRHVISAAGITSEFEYASVGQTPTMIKDRNGVCVLAPGTGLTVTTENNRDLRCSFFWRERVAEPSELNL